MDPVLDRFSSPALSSAMKIYIYYTNTYPYSFSRFTNFKKTALTVGFANFKMRLTE